MHNELSDNDAMLVPPEVIAIAATVLTLFIAVGELAQYV